MKTTTKIITIRQSNRAWYDDVHIRITHVLLDQREAAALQEFVYIAADDGDDRDEQARGVDTVLSHDAITHTDVRWTTELGQQPFDETERAIVDELTATDTDVFHIRFPRP